MTPTATERVIEKAMEGGFEYHDLPSGLSIEDYIAILASSPLFWQALSKKMGWGEPIPCPVIGCKKKYHSRNTKNWKGEWHSFIDALIAGERAEDFFAKLLPNND